MKKLLAGIVLSALLATGLVGALGTSATADPYPGTVPTKTHVKFPKEIRKGHSITIHVKVTASGNATPKGRVTCSVSRNKGGFSWSKTAKLSGGAASFTTPTLTKRGKYTVACSYKPKAKSVFKPSSDSGGFKVKKKKHKSH